MKFEIQKYTKKYGTAIAENARKEINSPKIEGNPLTTNVRSIFGFDWFL